MKTFLSPKEMAEAIGVSESSLKRWVDDGLLPASRTAGGHRRIAIGDAVRYIRQSALPVINPHALGLSDINTSAAMSDLDPTDSLTAALHDGDGPRAYGQILAMYLAGQSVTEIFDGPLAAAMQAIGQLWQHGEEGIYIEHRATDLCLGALHRLRTLMPPVDPRGPVAIGGGPADDPYILPSLMVATTLAAEGWRDINLGAETPIEVLSGAAETNQATLVWLAFSSDLPGNRAGAMADRLAADVAGWGASVVVGGRGWTSRIRTSKANIYPARSMGQLAAFARGLKLARDTRADADAEHNVVSQ